MPNANQVFNSGAVPFGSRWETVGTLVAGSPCTVSGGVLYYFERIDITYPTKTLERPGIIGDPNGFVLTRSQPTGSFVLQVPLGSGTYNTSTGGWDGVPWPALGSGFVDRFLAANEVWVISSLGTPFEMQGYYRVNGNMIQATLAGSGGL